MNEKELQKLAELARINMKNEDLQNLRKDMESILKYISQIQKVSSVEAESIGEPTRNVFREDIESHESGIYSADILKGAPHSKDGYIQVKKII